MGNIGLYIPDTGISGQLAYVVFSAFTTVVLPLTSAPIWPLALKVYGFWQAVILTFLGNFLGFCINFIVAKKYGRKLLFRFFGVVAVERTDRFIRTIMKKNVLGILFGVISFKIAAYSLGFVKKNSLLLLFIPTAFFVWLVIAFLLIERAVNSFNLELAAFVIFAAYLSLELVFRIRRKLNR